MLKEFTFIFSTSVSIFIKINSQQDNLRLLQMESTLQPAPNLVKTGKVNLTVSVNIYLLCHVESLVQVPRKYHFGSIFKIGFRDVAATPANIEDGDLINSRGR